MIAGSKESRIREGKKLFLEANIAIRDERFADAHRIAEELIRDHADDYKICHYLGLYKYTFFLVQEEYREGGIPPVDSPPPRWLKNKVEAMMAKRDKSVLDLVKLVAVGDKRICGENFPINYLEEIVGRFPESPWADWAEWLLIQEKEYRPREKYQGMRPEEKFKLLARDMYDAGKKFVEEHPDSHMVPSRLHVMATDRLVISDDEAAKEEAIKISRRILEEYPTDDNHCAIARLRLRRLLGDGYKEEEGCSEKQDRIITDFYNRKFELDDYKRSVRRYLSIKKGVEAQTEKEGAKPRKAEKETAKPSLLGGTAAYVAIAAVIGVGIVALILLLKKKASTRNK